MNSDEPEKAKRLLAEQATPWRNVLDGTTDGRLTTLWNVRAWPTVYLLDAHGVLRYRDLHHPVDVEPAVEALLKELEK